MQSISKTVLVAALAAGLTGSAMAETAVRDDLAGLFEDAQTRGTMVVHDHESDAVTIVGTERAGEAFTPASTFKIPNFLIGVEAGLATPDETFDYDAARDGSVAPGCDRTVTLAEGFARSCVPVYQEIARRVGTAGYADWLSRFDYGDGEVDDRNLTNFWLRGGITIDAEEQVAFLDRLTTAELPVAAETVDALKDAARLEEKNGAVLYAKTGWGTSREPGIGWFVGWVEDGEGVTTFALNLDMDAIDQAPIRREIALEILTELGYWPQG